MPRKGPVKLPQVSGATPRGGFQAEVEGGRPSRRAESLSTGEQSLDDPAMHLSGTLSQEEAQRLTEYLDASIDMPPGYGGESLAGDVSVGSSRAGVLAEWEVQLPEEVLRDVRRAVLQRHAVNPDEDFDSAYLERNARSPGLPGSVHIVLPDNRVRAVEDQLSRRVRAELLGDEGGVELATKSMGRTRRRPQDGRPTPRRPRNPWYLPPSAWHNPEAQKDPSAEPRGGFPYDSQILKNGDAESTPFEDQEPDANSGEGQARVLTKREKETLKIVEEYRNYMKSKGHRLPHFLQ